MRCDTCFGQTPLTSSFPIATVEQAEITRIDLSPLANLAIEFVLPVLSVLAGLALRRVLTWLRISEEARVRAYLEDAMQHGIQFARNRALAAGKRLDRIAVRDEMLADAVNYIVPKVPAALTRFGITPDGLRERLSARLGLVDPVTGSPSTIQPG